MFQTSHQPPQRRAVAATEFAVVLPLIVMLVLGAVEAARAVIVSHALQEAANAGCRVYSVEGTTQANASAIINTAMSNAGLTNHTIVFNPSSKAAVDVPLEPITVTVTIPYSQVAWLPPNFLSGATLQGRCVMPADIDRSDGGDTNGYFDSDDDQENDGNLRHENRDSSGGGDDDD
ncbi:MAG: pilus assembly protein [Lacipirellulaceae bacterium]